LRTPNMLRAALPLAISDLFVLFGPCATSITRSHPLYVSSHLRPGATTSACPRDT
jgi:hypothetical protein